MKTLGSFLAAGLVLWPASAVARDLYWRELGVQARLDAQGHLHVSERHRMVFSGDWNGGERTFDLRNGQDIVLESITRLGPGTSERRLAEGGLGNVDEYAWFDPFILRWRSRAATDPAFDEAELVYRIDYELIDVLGAESERDFILAHDFAFADRPGVIQHFHAQLELDPAWQLDQSQPIELEARDLPPGETRVLTLSLRHTGAEPPRPSTWVERRLRHLPAHLGLRLGLCALLVAAGFGLWARLLARARKRGHLAPLTPLDDIDGAWVTQHVLAHKPELVGALYDREIGEAEVAAVLARLELEGKVSSVARPTVEGFSHSELELTLLVPRTAFVGYERALIDKLFFAGDQTSNERIRQHYQTSGFKPAAALHALEDELQRLLAGGEPQPHLAALRALIAACLLLAQNTMLVQLLASSNAWKAAPVHVATTTGLVFFGCFAAASAAVFRNEVVDPERAGRPLRGCVVFVCLVFVPLMLTIPKLGPVGLVLFGLLALGVIVAILWWAEPLAAPAAITLRKRLVAARRYFEQQLREPEPRLDDAWFPYLIALGLAPDMDTWFRSFGGRESAEHAPRARPPVRDRDRDRSTPAPGAGSNPPSWAAAPSWTGGGGRFGGAGASGSWSSAAAGIAAGVAAPRGASDGSSSSSSSSSVSSSSDDARSGGGGGGGW